MRKRGKRNARRRENQRGMLLISIAALILLGSFLIQGSELQERKDYYQNRLESLKAQLEEEKERTRSILEEEEYMKTDDYIEAVAREKLGLIKENEILFKEIE